MAKRRLFRILSTVVRIKPGEERVAILLFAYFFLIMAPFTIVKSVRDWSYLEDLGPDKLPFGYATAILVGAIVALHARLQARMSRRSLLLATLAVFILTGLVFEQLFAATAWKWLPLVYWFWANILAVVLATQFWFLVNDIFNPREAKRLIGFFGSGGILGGIVGGLLTGILARPDTAHRLLFLVVAFLAACAVVIQALFVRLRKDGEIIGPVGAAAKERPPADREVGFRDSYRSVRESGYLKLLAAAVLVSGVVSTFIDWQSKTIIFGPGRPNLASFFGFFNSGLLTVAFLFQLVLTSRVIERFGLRLGLMVYPVLLLLGTAGLVAWPVLVAAMSLKGGDKALSYSVQQSARELLYIPVPPEAKYRAKIFIDMFLNRLSKSIGGVILLVLIVLPLGLNFRKSGPGVDPHLAVVGIASAALLVVWMLLNGRISRAYVREVKDNLARKWERADGIVAGRIDVDLAKLVIDTLESRRKSPELFALHLYELAKENKLTPDVRRLLEVSETDAGLTLAHPVLDSEEAPWVPAFEDSRPAVEMAREIGEIFALDSYRALMDEYAGRVLRETGAGAETAKMELAKALGLMDRNSPLAAKLEELLLDPSPQVFQYAAESAGRLRKRDSVPVLIRMLAEAKSREDARSALERYGPAITGTLADYLADADENADVRREAARLLGRMASVEAAAELFDALSREVDGLEPDILDALDHIRAERADVVLPAGPVLAHFDRDVAKACEAKAPADLLHLFMLLGLTYDHEDIFRAYQNLLKGTKDAVAYAIELLDLIVCPEVKASLFPILERFSASREAP